MKRKLILLDVDGTLISYSNILPDSAVKAIHSAQQQGHFCYIVTGRSRSHIEDEILNIGLNGIIGGNGAYIESQNKVIRNQAFSLEEVKRIVDYLEQQGLAYFMEANDGLYGSHHFRTRAISALQKYGIKDPIIAEVYPNMTFPQSLYQKNVIKINFILESYQDYFDFKQAFPEFQVTTWGGQGEKALFGDCTLKGIDKKDAILQLANYLHIDQEDIIAFGDAEIDISMFEISGISVCMSNGREKAKKAATYITDDVLDDGLYKAFKHFQLIKKNENKG